jgi:hypothetical protein
MQKRTHCHPYPSQCTVILNVVKDLQLLLNFARLQYRPEKL